MPYPDDFNASAFDARWGDHVPCDCGGEDCDDCRAQADLEPYKKLSALRELFRKDAEKLGDTSKFKAALEAYLGEEERG